MSQAKPYVISKWQVWRAFELVKANEGAAGIDKQTLADYEENLQDNLYKLWNRLSSGCYFPPAVKAVAIPKKPGGERILGIPTVSDRIAQMVVKLEFEPEVEPHFLPDSYGYRPCKSALDAIGVTIGYSNIVKMAVVKDTMKIGSLTFLAIHLDVGYVRIANEIVCLSVLRRR